MVFRVTLLRLRKSGWLDLASFIYSPKVWFTIILFFCFFYSGMDWNGYNIFVGKTSTNSVIMNVWVFKAPQVWAMRQLDLFYCIFKAEAVTGVEPIGAVGFLYTHSIFAGLHKNFAPLAQVVSTGLFSLSSKSLKSDLSFRCDRQWLDFGP